MVSRTSLRVGSSPISSTLIDETGTTFFLPLRVSSTVHTSMSIRVWRRRCAGGPTKSHTDGIEDARFRELNVDVDRSAKNGVPWHRQVTLRSIRHVQKLPWSSGVSILPSLLTNTTVSGTIRKKFDRVFIFISESLIFVTPGLFVPLIANREEDLALASIIAQSTSISPTTHTCTCTSTVTAQSYSVLLRCSSTLII